VGLGFSEALKHRRPMLKASPQDAVVMLKQADNCKNVTATGLLSAQATAVYESACCSTLGSADPALLQSCRKAIHERNIY